jgi:hypothetical protein
MCTEMRIRHAQAAKLRPRDRQENAAPTAAEDTEKPPCHVPHPLRTCRQGPPPGMERWWITRCLGFGASQFISARIQYKHHTRLSPTFGQTKVHDEKACCTHTTSHLDTVKAPCNINYLFKRTYS